MKLVHRLTGMALTAFAFVAAAKVPAGYPADYAAIVAAAQKEGKAGIYSATDTAAANPLHAEDGKAQGQVHVVRH